MATGPTLGNGFDARAPGGFARRYSFGRLQAYGPIRFESQAHWRPATVAFGSARGLGLGRERSPYSTLHGGNLRIREHVEFAGAFALR